MATNLSHYETPAGLAARRTLYSGNNDNQLSAIDRAVEVLAGWNPQTLADIGCGFGDALIRLRQDHHLTGRLIGIDCAEGMLAEPRRINAENGLGITFECGDALDLPFGNESLDAASLLFVLHAVERPQAALAEAWRCLKPKGRLLIGVHTEDDKPLRAMLMLAAAQRFNQPHLLLPAKVAHTDWALGWLSEIGCKRTFTETHSSALVITKPDAYLTHFATMRDLLFKPAIPEEDWTFFLEDARKSLAKQILENGHVDEVIGFSLITAIK